MTRRQWQRGASLLAATDAWGASGRVEVPILRVMDRYARCGEARVRHFYGEVWEEAFRMLARGGVSLRLTDRVGAVLKHPSGKPRFEGLERGVINLVLTDRVALDWDNGRRGGGGGDDFRGVLRVRDFDGGGARESGAVFRGEYGGA